MQDLINLVALLDKDIQKIHIKSYIYPCCENMIKNQMWGVLSIPDPHNKEEKWYLILHQYWFTWDYLEYHAKIPHKGYEQVNIWFRTWRDQDCN